jgi:hypothetical protein
MEDLSSNRLKRATTNMSPDEIKALDNISLFANLSAYGPESVPVGLFRMGLLELL